jgi:hypothetical protein
MTQVCGPTTPTHPRTHLHNLRHLICTLALAWATLISPQDRRPGGLSSPGWARQLRVLGLSNTEYPPQVVQLTNDELRSHWKWAHDHAPPELKEDMSHIATMLWHNNEGLNARIRATPDEVIAAVSSELMAICKMVKDAELSRTDQKKVTICCACGQQPMLPITNGRTSHTCAGCDLPIHTVFACPAYRVFVVEHQEGTYYCRVCAPSHSRNENLLTPTAARKQPDFQARSVSDPHTPIGTRVDAQDAIAQRLRERAAAQDVSMGGHSGGEPTLTPESSGQASNPYRIPKATPPPKEVKPEQERSHRVMISNPDNKIALDDDFVALQFHEACSDLDIPDFSEQCSAMCVGNGQTGPWLISVSPDAYQVVHSGALKSFECYTADEAEVTLRVLPCDSYGAPIRTVSKRSEPDTRHSVMKQKADDIKLLLVLNLPRRCLGKSLEAGKLESVREHIETIVKKMTGTKHGLAQGLSKNFKLKKNSLNLFLNPPLNLEDPYRLIRPLLPQLKVFPYEGDGLQPEPVTCFMPPSTAEKLKISPCCFYPPDVCISRQREGRCTVKQDEISSWRSPISRVPAAVSERNERKRARHVAEQQTEAAIDAAKAFRVSSIKKKLCKLFAEGKVGAAPPPPTIHAPHTVLASPPVRQLRMPNAPRSHLRQEAYRLCIRTFPRAHPPGTRAPHVPFHGRGGGEALPVPKPRPDVRVDARHRDVHLVKPKQYPPAHAGQTVHPTRGTTSGQRIPVQTREPEGSGVGKLHAQQGCFPRPAASPLPLPALRRNSRLARRLACGAQPREYLSRRRVHELSLHHVVPRLPTWEAPTRTPRVHRGRVARSHVAPGHCHGPTLARSLRRRRSQRLRPSLSPLRIHVDRVLWYTSNVLWLQGRLPWNIDRLCLG